MKVVRPFLLLFVGFCFLANAAAQESPPPVPRLVNFSGRVSNTPDKAVPTMNGITFSIYKDQYQGSPLWMETQNVRADARGFYSVQLGATRSEGLPLELFTSGEARWLGVRVNGQDEQPRVLLLSVPYALKAADAATIGGLPPSAFVLASPANAGGASASSSSTRNLAGDALNPALGGAGTLNFVPLWTPDGNTLGNSALFQSGTQMGLNTTTPAATLDVNGTLISRGLLQLPSTGTANAGGGFSSQPFALQGSSFSSSTQHAIGPVFQWQTEPAGNNTSNPAGTLNLLYGTGSGLPSETGLNIASNGRITFASGQTFPGAGTITGITAGTGLSGGGTSGNVTLSINIPFANQNFANLKNANTFTKNQTVTANLIAQQLILTAAQGTAPLQVTSTTLVPNLNVGLLGGLPASAFQVAGSYAGLGANTFTGDQNVSGNVTGSGTVTGGVVNATTGFNLAGVPFASGSLANSNAFVGFAGNFTGTGNFNTATGVSALPANTTGLANTAYGYSALQLNTSGQQNTALGTKALQANISGSGNMAAGDGALEFTTGDNNSAAGSFAFLFNSTGSGNSALGYFAGVPTVSNVFTTGTNDTYVGIFANSGPQLNLTNATAIGALAQVTASNAMVLGSINGVNGATADTFVGIGTTAPAAKLDVHGNANFTGSITFAPGQTFPGTGTVTGVTAGTDLTGGGTGGGVTLNLDTTKVPQLATANAFAATQTISTGDLTLNNGNLNLSNNAVVTLGGSRFISASQGLANTFVGVGTANPANGSDNTALGAGALQVNSSGQSNTAIGSSALRSNNSSLNTAVGYEVLQANSSGAQNTGVGASALSVSSTGFGDTGVGANALEFNTTGSGNTAVGTSALLKSTTGTANTSVGEDSALGNTTGSSNSALGAQALSSNSEGSNNTAVGFNALATTSGSNNTAVGLNAGISTNSTFTPGSSNTFVGANANLGTQSSLSNSAAIGANAQVTANNAMVLGSINGVNGATADTFVGIGITAPTHKFHVGPGNNSFRVDGPPQGTTSPIVASFGGTGDFRIDAVNVGGGRFLVKDNGFVGINTTAPDATLSVNGSADKPGGGSWSTFSDRRLKNLDGNFDSGLSQILKLHPIRYRYKEENALGIQDHEQHVGFVAQDVQKVIPEAVTENSKGYLLVNNDPILWTMLNAIKEQQREIKQQQGQITALRTQLRQRAAKDALLESRLAQLEQLRVEKTRLALARNTP